MNVSEDLKIIMEASVDGIYYIIFVRKILNTFDAALLVKLETSEAAVLRCYEEKMLWKYAANLQENTHAEVWFQ